MPATATVDTTDFSIDRKTHTISYKRLFTVAPQQVFDAWTKAEQVALWWDPTGDPLADCKIDLRVGGSFSFVNKAHPDRPFSGTYKEISPPDHLVFVAVGDSTGRVAFEDRNGGTLMTVRIECGSAEQLENFVRFGIDRGTSATLDNLVRYLSGMRRGA